MTFLYTGFMIYCNPSFRMIWLDLNSLIAKALTTYSWLDNIVSIVNNDIIGIENVANVVKNIPWHYNTHQRSIFRNIGCQGCWVCWSKKIGEVTPKTEVAGVAETVLTLLIRGLSSET